MPTLNLIYAKDGVRQHTAHILSIGYHFNPCVSLKIYKKEQYVTANICVRYTMIILCTSIPKLAFHLFFS